MLGSLHEDEIGIQEPQLFVQTFADDFLHQSFDSNLSSNATSTIALNGSVLELSRFVSNLLLCELAQRVAFLCMAVVVTCHTSRFFCHERSWSARHPVEEQCDTIMS